MGNGHITSVSAGRAVSAGWAGELKRTAIDKRPVAGAVRVGRLGLDGDEQADTASHGGPEQAVYVYAREDLDWWQGELDRDLRDGFFGENITTVGVDVTGALIGERWRLGAAVVQVTAPRIPCVVFRNWTGETGWVKRFARAARPGAYLRVLAEGAVAAGDPVTVLDRPGVRVTVAEAMRVFYQRDVATARQLISVLGPGAKWSEMVAGWLSTARSVQTGTAADAGP